MMPARRHVRALSCRPRMTTLLPLLLAACSAAPLPPAQDVAGPPSPPVTRPPAAAAADKIAAHWRVVGTEPFWSVRADGGSLVFSTPDLPQGRTLAARVEQVAGAIEFRGHDRGQPFSLQLSPGTCSDGMSDRRYAFRARFAIGGTSYEGCADAVGADGEGGN